MSIRFVSKWDEMDSLRKKKRIYGIISSVLLILSLLLFSFHDFINKTYLQSVGDIRIVFAIIAFSAFVFAYENLVFPFSPYDSAFYELVKALRILEAPVITNSRRNEAMKMVLTAHKKILSTKSLRRQDVPPWIHGVSQIEKTFIDNLKTRIAPAIKNATIKKTNLTDVLWALQGNDISMLEMTNSVMEKTLVEIIEPEKSITKYFSIISSSKEWKKAAHYFSVIESSKMGMIIISFLIAFFSILIFLYGVTIFADKKLIPLIADNPFKFAQLFFFAFFGYTILFEVKKRRSIIA